jgi:hypothetical protein
MITLAKWSVEDYHRMIEAGIFLRDRRVELLAGEELRQGEIAPLAFPEIKVLVNSFFS